jgi:hypothetical protein
MRDYSEYEGYDCIVCGKPVNPRRVKAIMPKSKDMQRFFECKCLSCVKSKGDVTRVGGVTIIAGKNDYSSVQLVPQSYASRVNKLMDRKGMSPSQGMKNGVN